MSIGINLTLVFFDRKSESEADKRKSSRTVGHYYVENGQTITGLDVTDAPAPEYAMAIIAHEVCHVRLLGENRITADRPLHDPEATADDDMGARFVLRRVHQIAAVEPHRRAVGDRGEHPVGQVAVAESWRYRAWIVVRQDPHGERHYRDGSGSIRHADKAAGAHGPHQPFAHFRPRPDWRQLMCGAGLQAPRATDERRRCREGPPPHPGGHTGPHELYEQSATPVNDRDKKGKVAEITNPPTNAALPIVIRLRRARRSEGQRGERDT